MACINLYNPYGEIQAFVEGGELYFLPPINQRHLVDTLKVLEARLDVRYSDTIYSDYGAFLLQLGNYVEGLHVFQQLIVKRPNQYQIIQNLGTAYELNGQLDSALFYIQKGLKINPDSHRKSEWIHVKILEAEIALKKDPNYLKSHLTILGLPTQPNDNPRDGDAARKNAQILFQVQHQLTERIPFSPPPNPIMSAIFYELGKFYYHFHDEDAYNCFRLALWYGSHTVDSVEKEKAISIQYLRERDKKYFKNPEKRIKFKAPEFMIDSGFHYQAVFFPKNSFLPTQKMEFNKVNLLWFLGILILALGSVAFWKWKKTK